VRNLNVVASLVGGALLAVGVGLVFPPAGLVVLGAELLGAGLLMDDNQ
jgi:hypothetical protein